MGPTRARARRRVQAGREASRRERRLPLREHGEAARRRLPQARRAGRVRRTRHESGMVQLAPPPRPRGDRSRLLEHGVGAAHALPQLRRHQRDRERPTVRPVLLGRRRERRADRFARQRGQPSADEGRRERRAADYVRGGLGAGRGRFPRQRRQGLLLGRPRLRLPDLLGACARDVIERRGARHLRGAADRRRPQLPARVGRGDRPPGDPQRRREARGTSSSPGTMSWASRATGSRSTTTRSS